VRILLVRLRLIGDVVFTTPAIGAIRQQWPNAHLTYLVEPASAPVVARNRQLNEILVAPRSRGLERLRDDLDLARRLRATRYDIAVDFHGGPRSAWLTTASGAPMRVGYEMPGRRWIYTHRVRRPRGLRPRHSVENQWDLLAPLGPAFQRPPDPSRDPVVMDADRDADAALERRLLAAGVGSDDHLMVVHVSAGNPFRRWPVASFVEVVAALAEADRRRRILVTSGPSEHSVAGVIAAGARERTVADLRSAILDLEVTLPELRAAIGRAVLFIGGDSGPLHVAATTRVSIVGIYGPTLPARSGPWRDPACITESVEVGGLSCRPCDQRRCLPGDFRCLGWTAPAAVLAAAERAMERAS
jgi:ADP-heptose:LPS heptosyltransferase